jgi:hypothetical protein
MKAEFYLMDFNAWDHGTVDLSLEEEAALLRLCHAMYRNHGPIANSLRHLASLWRCHQNKARYLLNRLVQARVVDQTEDGKLVNATAMALLEKRKTVSRRLGEAGRIGGARTAHNRRQRVDDAGQQADIPANVLENHDPDVATA